MYQTGVSTSYFPTARCLGSRSWDQCAKTAVGKCGWRAWPVSCITGLEGQARMKKYILFGGFKDELFALLQSQNSI